MLAGPLLIATALAQRGQDWMRYPPSETLIYSSDLVNSFVPPALHPLWPGLAQALQARLPERNTAERAVFLGYTPLVLGAAVVWLRRRRAQVFWALAAAATWLLSLGPVLQVLGRSSFTAFGVQVPLPYLALYTFVPGFSIMRVPARFVVLTSLALAVLVGYALAAIGGRAAPDAAPATPSPAAAPPPRFRRRFSPGQVRGAYVAVFALIALEFLAIPYPMAPPGYHIPFYEQVAKEPGHFAILELPLRPMSDYLAYQTVHGKPIVYGYLSRQPPDPFVEQTPALHYLLPDTPPDTLTAAQAAAAAPALPAAGIRYVVVHWWALTAPQAAGPARQARRPLPRPNPDGRPRRPDEHLPPGRRGAVGPARGIVCGSVAPSRVRATPPVARKTGGSPQSSAHNRIRNRGT